MSINREMKKRFFACDVDADNIYISTYEGMLFSGDKKTMEMSIVRCEKGRELLHSSPAERMAVCGKYIYMFCCDYKKVNVFDMIEKSCTGLLDYQNDPNMNRSICGYFLTLKKDEIVYVFVDNQYGFYKLFNKHYMFIEFNATISKYNWSSENVLAYSDYDSSNAYFYFIDCGKMLCFESDTEHWREYGLQAKIENPISIQKHEDYLYVLTRNNNYYKSGLKDNNLVETVLSDSLIGKDWDHLIVTDQKVFLIPGANDEIVEIQMGQGESEIRYINYPSDFKCLLIEEYRSLFHKFREFCEDEVFRYYSERYYNFMMKINKKSGEIGWSNILWPDDRSFIEDKMIKGEIIHESDYDLQDWLLTVVNT